MGKQKTLYVSLSKIVINVLKNAECDLKPTLRQFHFLLISNAAAQLILVYFCVRFLRFHSLSFSLYCFSFHFFFRPHHLFPIFAYFYCFLNGIQKCIRSSQILCWMFRKRHLLASFWSAFIVFRTELLGPLFRYRLMFASQKMSSKCQAWLSPLFFGATPKSFTPWPNCNIRIEFCLVSIRIFVSANGALQILSVIMYTWSIVLNHIAQHMYQHNLNAKKNEIKLKERLKLSIRDDVTTPRSLQKHLFLYCKLLTIYALCSHPTINTILTNAAKKVFEWHIHIYTPTYARVTCNYFPMFVTIVIVVLHHHVAAFDVVAFAFAFAATNQLQLNLCVDV